MVGAEAEQVHLDIPQGIQEIQGKLKTQPLKFPRPLTRASLTRLKITPRAILGAWELEPVILEIQMTLMTLDIRGRLLGNLEGTIPEPTMPDLGLGTLMEARALKTHNLGPEVRITLSGDLPEMEIRVTNLEASLPEMEVQAILSGDLTVAEAMETRSGDPMVVDAAGTPLGDHQVVEAQDTLSGDRVTLTGDPQEVQDTHLGVVDLEEAVSLLTVADLKGVIVLLPSDQIIGKIINTWAMEEFSMPVLKILMASIAMNLPRESSGCQLCSLSRGTPS